MNTLRNCPRRFFYRYVVHTQEEKGIQLICGAAVHQAIDARVKNPEKTVEEHFDEVWSSRKEELSKLGVVANDEKFLYEKYVKMAVTWESMQVPGSKLETEVRLYSEAHGLMGILDEVVEFDGSKGVVENKTSALDAVTKDTRIQLGIGAILFKENYGRWPDFLMVRFLARGTYKLLTPDDELVDGALDAADKVRRQMFMRGPESFPRKVGPFCKWKGGQCGFFERCAPPLKN